MVSIEKFQGGIYVKLPLSWLSDYTDISGVTPKEYDARLTMSGSKVEEVFYLGAEIENVVTGKVLSVICLLYTSITCGSPAASNTRMGCGGAPRTINS